MDLNLKDFKARMKSNDFMYNSYEGTIEVDGEPHSSVCWLGSLIGPKPAEKLSRKLKRTAKERFLNRIPEWADYSEKAVQLENAALVASILERDHTPAEFRKINECLSEVAKELRRDLGPGPFSEYTALLFAAAAVSERLAEQRRK